MELSGDFESVVSTISPLRHCWFSAAFRGFLPDYEASFGTIWTGSLHKSLHTKAMANRTARILSRGAPDRKLDAAGVVMACILGLTTGLSHADDIAYSCPRIIPQRAYDHLLSLSEVRMVSSRQLKGLCGNHLVACAQPYLQDGRVVKAEVYIRADLSPPLRNDALLHEVCHLYEIDSRARTIDETRAHEGWL